MAHIHIRDLSPEFGPDLGADEALALFCSRLAPLASVSFGGEAPQTTTVLVEGRPTENDALLKDLEALVVPFAGVPAPAAEFARKRPGLLLASLHFNGEATSEMAVGLLIAAAREIAAADRDLRQGRWRGRFEGQGGTLLAGKTATVLGYGTVGRRVGAILSALGMRVIGVRRTYDPAEPAVLGIDHLDDALSDSHALVVTAPATTATLHLIGTQELARLRRPRMVVNVGRGPIIQEEALFRACSDRTISAAGIDVWYRYPSELNEEPCFPSNFPFQDLDNVVLSPHAGGSGDDTERLRTVALLDLLTRILKGEPVRAASPELGY